MLRVAHRGTVITVSINIGNLLFITNLLSNCKIFNARDARDQMVSAHDTENYALEWVRWYCFMEHGEMIDVAG